MSLPGAIRRHWPTFRRLGPVSFLRRAFNALQADRAVAARAAVVHHGPVAAQIEPTNLCNFECAMCIRDRADLPRGSISLDDFKTILDRLPTLVRIQLQGQGEPFVHRDLVAMIQEAARRGIEVTVTTNGSLLDAATIDAVLESGLASLAVSIDDLPADGAADRWRRAADRFESRCSTPTES